MSEMAKSLRAKMREKAKAMSSQKDQKVDSSDWTPAEMLNADVKTGLRPISRRAFKTGGKVMGEACAPRADRKPRKKGGKVEVENEKSEAKQYAIAKMNRNVKEANEEREGIKHVGGMKKGGVAKKADGGKADDMPMTPPPASMRTDKPENVYRPTYSKESVDKAIASSRQKIGSREGKMIHALLKGRTGRNNGGYSTQKDANETPSAADQERMRREMERQRQQAREEGAGVRKAGGRAKKMDGGMLAGLAGGLIPGLVAAGMKKDKDEKKFGGRAKRKDGGEVNYGPMEMPAGKKGASEAEQRRTESYQENLSKASRGKAGHYADGGYLKFKGDPVIPGMKEGGKTKWIQSAIKKPGALRKSLGVKEGQTIPAKKLEAAAEKGGKLGQRARLAQTLGRMQRKDGGRAKKPGTNVNIVIATRQPASFMGGMPSDMGMPPMPKPPGGVPVPMPPPGMGAPPMGGMPMPPPAPPLGGGLPPGMPPMARKDGGRITKIAKSYKDMEAGSGGGEGRLQKTDIAKLGKDAPSYRKGGKVYRSYKDMDAGAGSGEGRLEKSEIQKRKH